MLDVVLVHPYVLRRHPAQIAAYRPYPPLALLHAGAVLEAAGHRVALYDGTFQNERTQIVEWLRPHGRPKVALLFAMNAYRDDALATIKLLKELGIWVVAAGPDPSAYDQEYLTQGADVVLRGEFERALLELLTAFGFWPAPRNDGPVWPAEARPVSRACRPNDERLLAIAGVSILDGDVNFRRAPDRPPAPPNDERPSPAYALADLPLYLAEWRRVHGYASMPFMTFAGGPFGSNGAAGPSLGRTFPTYGPERAADEISLLVERFEVDHLLLFDDTFAVERAWVERLCRTLIDRAIRVRFSCGLPPARVDRRLLDLMRAAGCERIDFSFESSFIPVPTGASAAQVRQVAQDAHELGIALGGSLWFGHPEECWREIDAKIRLLRALQPIDYVTRVGLPLRGSEFFGQLRERLLEEEPAAVLGPDQLLWSPAYSGSFYRLVESLLETEYDLGLEFSLRSFLKARLLRGVLGLLRLSGEGRGARRPGILEVTGAAEVPFFAEAV